jgi:hypothetical protein
MVTNVIQTFNHSVAHTIHLHIYMAHFPLLPSPLAGFPLLPFVFLSTYLAPSSCDRNRPPPSQVACKLTPFAPPFTQLTHPLQIPRTPPAPRLTMTTSGIFRLLLSGTGRMLQLLQHHRLENKRIDLAKLQKFLPQNSP